MIRSSHNVKPRVSRFQFLLVSSKRSRTRLAVNVIKKMIIKHGAVVRVVKSLVQKKHAQVPPFFFYVLWVTESRVFGRQERKEWENLYLKILYFTSPGAILLVGCSVLRTTHHFPVRWLPCVTSPGLVRGIIYMNWLLSVSPVSWNFPCQELWSNLCIN